MILAILCQHPKRRKKSLITYQDLQLCGIKPHKSLFNSKSVLDDIPPEENVPSSKSCRGNPFQKGSGVRWDPISDELRPYSDATPVPNFTLRKPLSYVGALFDPLGLISPVTITAMIIQDIHSQNIGLDDTLPEKLNDRSRNGCIHWWG